MKFDKVGIIGIGLVGSGMTVPMLEDGREVHGFDISPDAMAAAEARGIVPAGSPREVADRVGAILLSLPQSDVVAEVCLGKNGIIETSNPDVLIIDTSSGYPTKAVEIAAKLKEMGIRMIDAPVTGGEGGASVAAPSRGMTMIVGGDDADIDEAMPLLESLSKHVFKVGKLGNGHLIKAINNLVAFSTGIANTEGLLVGAAHGIDPATIAECLTVGTGQTFNIRAYLNKPGGSGAGDNKPTKGSFEIGLMPKDLGHMSQLAREAGVPAFATDAAFHIAQLMVRELGYKAPYSEKDSVMEKWAGIRLDGTRI